MIGVQKNKMQLAKDAIFVEQKTIKKLLDLKIK